MMGLRVPVLLVLGNGFRPISVGSFRKSLALFWLYGPREFYGVGCGAWASQSAAGTTSFIRTVTR